MEDILKQILEKLDALSKDVAELKEGQSTLATSEEVQAVAETLEMIAVGEVAVTKTNLEDKIESGDVLNKTLIDGLEDRLTRKLEEGFKQAEDRFKEIGEGINIIIDNQQKMVETLRAFHDRFEYQDELVNLFDKRLKNQERLTRELQQKLKALGGDAS